MMNKRLGAACLLACLLTVGAQGVAQDATYVFPYEGLRYTQQEGETVLTQTNLGEHQELIASLGTTADAVLSSYIASGIVMEVIPDDGGQIAVSVVDAGEFAGVQDMDEMSDAQREAFLAQFSESGLYETCEWTKTEPQCVRLTASSMYGTVQVYTLRYATLHLGRVCLLTQTVVGRVPSLEDDARMERVLSGLHFLSSVTQPTPSPTPAPTATPEPTPVPTAGVAQAVGTEGEMTVEGVPAFTNSADLTLTGTVDASQEVTVSLNGESLGKTTAKKDGTFSLRVKLPQEGDLTLVVSTDTAERMFSLRYEMPVANIAVTEPEETTFTGSTVVLRGETEADAKVYVETEGFKTNVTANRNGAFSVRLNIDSEGAHTYTLTAQADGFKDGSTQVTLTRELTQKEWIANFRLKMIEIDYDSVVADPAAYQGKQFIERGRVMEFADYNGSPCALVCIDNPATGVWTQPLWVVLDQSADAEVGDILTFYLVGEGISLPADDQYYKSGVATGEAPVTRALYWTENK